jgi:hypothetical protein
MRTLHWRGCHSHHEPTHSVFSLTADRPLDHSHIHSGFISPQKHSWASTYRVLIPTEIPVPFPESNPPMPFYTQRFTFRYVRLRRFNPSADRLPTISVSTSGLLSYPPGFTPSEVFSFTEVDPSFLNSSSYMLLILLEHKLLLKNAS